MSAYTDADLHYYATVTAPFHDGRVPQVWFERCRGLARELLEARRERDELRQELADVTGRFRESPHLAPKYYARAQAAERERDELRETVSGMKRTQVNLTKNAVALRAQLNAVRTYYERRHWDEGDLVTACEVLEIINPTTQINEYACCEHCGCGYGDREGHDDACSHGCNVAALLDGDTDHG